MDFIKRYWIQIAAHLKQLPAVTKLLIGSVLVIMLLVGSLMMLYAANPESQSIDNLIPVSKVAEARTALESDGVKVFELNGGLAVSSSQYARAMAVLAQSGITSRGFAKAFEDHVKRTNKIWTTAGQSKESFNFYKQVELARVVKNFGGVDHADVLISKARDTGFGAARTHPTAAVSLSMNGGAELTRSKAKSLAQFVSNAVPNMKLGDVKIMDAPNNRTFVFDGGAMDSADEVAGVKAAIELNQQRKIKNQLPSDTRVSVSAILDSTLRTEGEMILLDKTADVLSAETVKIKDTEGASGGAPGASANLPRAIGGGGGASGTERSEDTKIEKFAKRPTTKREKYVKGGSEILKFHVSLELSREHINRIYDVQHPDDKGKYDSAKLVPIIAKESARVEKQIEKFADGKEQGTVSVTVAPYTRGAFGGSQIATASAGGILGGIVSGEGPIDLKLLVTGGLGLFALAFMFGMARNATRRQNLPSIEELAGIPPSLPVDDELVGEAEEHESPMEGLELDEEEIRSRKIADQIAYLVNENPVEAGAIFKRWALSEE